jgi:hypothetical protein
MGAPQGCYTGPTRLCQNSLILQGFPEVFGQMAERESDEL